MRSNNALTRVLAGAALTATLGLGLVMSPPSEAYAKTIHVTVGTTTPSFVAVPGTRVYYTNDVGYRVYRYGGSYYIYQNGEWYRSSDLGEAFEPVQVGGIPASVVRVGRMGDEVEVGSASTSPIRIDLGSQAPEFVTVPGSRVYYTTNSGYRIYRYNGDYYVYRNGTWYRASAVSGDYAPVRTVIVPASVVHARTTTVQRTVVRHHTTQRHRRVYTVKHHRHAYKVRTHVESD